jgi:hypothetical protein
MTFSITEEYRYHPAYAQGLDAALRIVAAHSLASLSVDNAGQPEHVAGAIERELHALLADYDRRTGAAACR